MIASVMVGLVVAMDLTALMVSVVMSGLVVAMELERTHGFHNDVWTRGCYRV